MKPALPKVGMLQWDSYAQTVQLGYEHALWGWTMRRRRRGKCGGATH